MAEGTREVAVSRYAGERQEWDTFVRVAPGGTFFHLIGWKEVLEDTFGFAAHYYVARRAGGIVGVLPLFEIHAPLMKRCLLSVPFAVDGGVCAADEDARVALDAVAVRSCRELNARYVELRDGRSAPGFRVRDGTYFRFQRPLYTDDAANLAATPAKRRNMIRLGQRSGLVARVDAADLHVVHDLHAHTARRLGTPVFPLRYFRALQDRFPHDTAVLTVRRNDQPVAGVLLLFFGDSVCPYYVGSRREAFRFAVNDFLYWEVMRYARQRGARRFDFGRSKRETGAFEYKRLWGFDAVPLRYRVHGRDDTDISGYTTSDPRLRWVQRIWRRLPLRLTKLLGPGIVARYGPYFT